MRKIDLKKDGGEGLKVREEDYEKEINNKIINTKQNQIEFKKKRTRVKNMSAAATAASVSNLDK